MCASEWYRAVRLGFNDIDGGGFSRPQKKTGVQPWRPVFPELEAEMAAWERRPGPLLLQEDGRPFTANRLWKVFSEERAAQPAITAGCKLGNEVQASVARRLRAPP